METLRSSKNSPLPWTSHSSLLLSKTKSREVDYVAGFLTGNARLWYISSLEAGTSSPSWPSLKQALYLALGPSHEQETARLDLFAITQTVCLSDYVMAFTRLSLQIPGPNEHSRSLLFVRGLQPELKCKVLQEHPETLSHDVAAARTVQQARDMLRERVGQGPKDSNYKKTVFPRLALCTVCSSFFWNSFETTLGWGTCKVHARETMFRM